MIPEGRRRPVGLGGVYPHLARGAVLCAVLVMLVPSARAGEAPNVVAEFDGLEGPVLTGKLAIVGDEASVILDRPGLLFKARVLRAEIEIVHVRTGVFGTPFGEVAYAPEYNNTTYRISDAIFTFVGDDTPVVYAHLHGAQAVDLAASEPWALPLRADVAGYSYGMDSSLPFFFSDVGVGDPIRIEEDAASARLTGAGLMFFAEGAIEWTSAEGRVVERLGYTRRAEGPTTPLGPLREVDEYSFARVDVSDADINISGAARIDIQPLHVRWDGSLLTKDATGFVRTGIYRHVLVREDVTFHGRGIFTPGAPPQPDDGASLEGTLTKIEFHGARGSVTPYGVEKTLVAALLSALLLLAPAGRQLIGGTLAACYTRLRPENVARGKRLVILRQIIEKPGVHARGLQRAMGCGWGEIHYHLDVLRRNGYITATKDNGRTHYFPVGARQPQTGGNVDGLSLRTLAIYRAIAASGALTLREIRATTGASRQLVTYHLGILEARGLVVRSGGRPRRYERAPNSEPMSSIPDGSVGATTSG